MVTEQFGDSDFRCDCDFEWKQFGDSDVAIVILNECRQFGDSDFRGDCDLNESSLAIVISW